MLAAFWVVVLMAGPPAQGAPAPQTLDAYIASLDRLAAAVEHLDEQHPEGGAVLEAALPRGWVIATAGRPWWIPNDEVRTALLAWEAHPDATARRRILNRLHLARAQAASYGAPAADSGTPHAALAAILARKEFRSIHGPTWFDQLRERATRWLVGLLQRIVGSSAFPTITSVAVYVLIVVAVLATALWMFRALRRSAASEATALQIEVVPQRSWNVWLSKAREAANHDDWREAVRHAYWCAIAWLETRGAWRPDPSRTPREYLGLLPATHEHARALRTLTTLTEHVWYGAAPAGAAQFEDALARLTDLGCPTA